MWVELTECQKSELTQKQIKREETERKRLLFIWPMFGLFFAFAVVLAWAIPNNGSFPGRYRPFPELPVFLFAFGLVSLVFCPIGFAVGLIGLFRFRQMSEKERTELIRKRIDKDQKTICPECDQFYPNEERTCTICGSATRDRMNFIWKDE